MGGKNEFKAASLRIHESGGEVHVHDDKKKIKFVMPVDRWKVEYPRLRAETLKSNFGLLFDDGGTELHAKLAGREVQFELRSAITGFEDFDSFLDGLEDAPAEEPKA